MKTIKIVLDDAILAGMVAEQLARIKNIEINDAQPDLVISRVRTDYAGPHLLLGGKAGENCDVLPLPLRLGELNDRVGYILSGRDRFTQEDTIAFNGLTLNAEDGIMLRVADGAQIRLTDKEKLLILSLYAEESRSLDRAGLLQKVWSYSENAETHTLETHLYRLRQKLEDGFGLTDLIVTRDGVYTLNVDGALR